METRQPPKNLLSLYDEIEARTHLIKFCGTSKLFRDRYQITQLLGRGGFGVTFLARDLRSPNKSWCVIKQLCPKVTEPAVLQRARKGFSREAKMLSKLGNHSRIPQLLNYFEAEGEFYLVQEYIPGMTLTKEVRRYGVFSEEKVKLFLREILPLIQFIHYQGAIHRDIKPPNIIRSDRDGKLVLIDFGAVKEKLYQTSLEHASMSATPTTTQFVGTLGFAPPEQLSLHPVHASDIYAVGITCLFLLTGKTPLQLEINPKTGEIQWRDLVEVSDYFAQVIEKMIKPAVRERYSSANHVVRALDLEEHLDTLGKCMVETPLSRQDPQHKTTNQEYISPTKRAAIAIQKRLYRMQNRKPIKPLW